METYIDVFINSDGKKASEIFEKLTGMGLKYYIGEHDFIYNWKRIVTIKEELTFVDRIQDTLKGTKTILKFTTIR
ncbi:hypothetical protein AYK20_06480 [Thermoplasmatales archaeon SG8-52-1]|nr:MAG: hypothetical protein AYK20_06480 [Thermoplasmatales archaeon SG8-52-1]